MADTHDESVVADVDPDDFRDLTAIEVMQLETAVQDAHDVCPECDESYIQVGVFNDGSLQFVHDRTGMFVDGCAIDSRETVLEVLGQ